MSEKAEATVKDLDSGEGGSQRLVEVKVGAFVLITLITAVAIIMALAQKRHVFERRIIIHTVFQNIEGLQEGAPVRLSGVNIGLVSKIAFAKEKHASLIHVDMQISRSALERIGSDSLARIGTQGMLGDKLIELTVSDGPSETLAAGATIQSVPPTDFNRIIEQASAVLARVSTVADNAAVFTGSLSNPQSLENIHGIIQSVRKLAVTAERGPGLVHALFYDPEQAKALRTILADVDRLGQHVDQVVVRVDNVLGATDKDGLQLVNNLSRAAKNIGDTAGNINGSKIIPNLDQASGGLSEVIAFVNSGRGTIGMALKDPTVYEQLVTVLGGVARSRVLRALVRYAIFKDDGQKVGKAVDEPAVSDIVKAHGK